MAVNVAFGTAEDMCRSHNSTLISIHSREEQELILSLGRQHYTMSGVHWIWLGAYRNTSDTKEFFWKDGSTFNFTNWREGCPDNRVSENCVLMTVFRDRPSHWCNFKCESNYDHVVCQKEYTNDTNEVVSTPQSLSPFYSTPRPRIRPTIPLYPPGESPIRPLRPRPSSRPAIWLETHECDIGWDFKNNKCYKFIGENITGEEARYYCKRFGESAKALTITTEAEQTWAVEFAFYKNEAKDAIWLGAARIGPNTVAWRDGSPMNYSNWSPHEPDNRNNSENCVALNDMAKFFGRWLDAPCGLKFHLICEKKAKIPLKDPVINASNWNEVFGDVTEKPLRIRAPEQFDGLKVSRSSVAISGFMITMLVFLTIIVIMLSFVVYYQRKVIQRNMRESRVNIYYASQGPGYEEYEEPKYNEGNSSRSSAYAETTTASLIDASPTPLPPTLPPFNNPRQVPRVWTERLKHLSLCETTGWHLFLQVIIPIFEADDTFFETLYHTSNSWLSVCHNSPVQLLDSTFISFTISYHLLFPNQKNQPHSSSFWISNEKSFFSRTKIQDWKLRWCVLLIKKCDSRSSFPEELCLSTI